MTVTGFIAPAGDGFSAGYTIARIVISCCAADANPMQLHVAGDAPFRRTPGCRPSSPLVPDTATLDNGYVPTVTITSMQTDPAAGRSVRALSGPTVIRIAVGGEPVP